MLSERGFGQPNQLDSANAVELPCKALELPLASEGGYRMIHSLSVENFRCFQQMSLQDLRLINVVVGDNGSGKTSLLETVFLGAGGHPTHALRLRNFRGYGEGQIDLDRASFETLWKDLFFQLDQERHIKISLVGSAENTRSVEIQYREDAEEISVPIGKGLQDATSIVPIAFSYRTPSERHEFVAAIGGEGLKMKGAAPAMPVSYFSASLRPSPQEAAKRFSDLSIKKGAAKFADTFARVYPQIKSVSAELRAGAGLLYGEVDWLPEKVPLSLISDGAFRLASYLIGIAATAKGVVLIDEVENGFYYKKMPEIWRALYSFAKAYKTQLIIATHSLECLQAATDVVEGNETEFTLLRSIRSSNGYESEVAYITGEGFRGAMDAELEIR